MANDLLGLLETGATLGTGAVSGLLGMPYGLYKGITSGAYGTPLANRIAEEEARKFMERNTYQPRTQAGQENLQAIAGLLEKSKLPPVMPEAALLSAIPVQAYAAQAERAGMAAEKAIEPAVRRTMERGGLPAQLLGDLSQGSIRPMDVWHGSPYRFDKFDPTKIGSGEGAQAFSYGHYFGEARGTGEQYRDVLKQKQFAKIVEKGRNDFDVIAPDGTVLAEGVYRGAAQKAYDAFNKEAGNLYKVDLPDEAIANMLDWDKPYNKQPKQVQDALKNSNVAEIWKAQYGFDIEKNQPQMDMVYKAVAEQLGSPAAASQYFKDLGILGTRYLDEGSRAAGKGTSNFVVFPGGEDLLTIKEINDKPVGGLLGQSKAALTPIFETGKEVTFPFIKNTEKAPKMSGFGQDIEPAGNYILSGHDVDRSKLASGWTTGEISFKNPLVIDWGKSGLYTEPDNWKQVLSSQYGGKTGKALSKAIAKDGYDGIVTMTEYGPSEIVDLSMFSKKKQSLLD